jgi:hypothetical protein
MLLRCICFLQLPPRWRLATAGVVDCILRIEDCDCITGAKQAQNRFRRQGMPGAYAGAQRKDALILSSAAEPGQISLASSVLSGFSTVLRWECRSSESGST